MFTNGPNRFLFDVKLASRLYGINSSKQKNNARNKKEELSTPLDETDDCETESNVLNEDSAVRNEQNEEILSSLKHAIFKHFSHTVNIDLDDTAFVRIERKDGQYSVFKKSSIVWYLESAVKRLSNDRTLRVRQTKNHF